MSIPMVPVDDLLKRLRNASDHMREDHNHTEDNLFDCAIDALERMERLCVVLSKSRGAYQSELQMLEGKVHESRDAANRMWKCCGHLIDRASFMRDYPWLDNIECLE